MRFNIIVMVMLILFSVSVLGDLCYQDQANVTSSCSLVYTGVYDSNGIGNWNWADSNYATGSGNSGQVFYVNYTKPDFSRNTSLWQIKPNVNVGTTSNVTIDDCWDTNPTTVNFKITTSTHTWWYCQNSTGWQQVGYCGTCSNWVYEEGMYWNMSIYTSGLDDNPWLWDFEGYLDIVEPYVEEIGADQKTEHFVRLPTYVNVKNSVAQFVGNQNGSIIVNGSNITTQLAYLNFSNSSSIYNLSLPASHIQNYIDDCACTNCTLDGTLCTLPLYFTSENIIWNHTFYDIMFDVDYTIFSEPVNYTFQNEYWVYNYSNEDTFDPDNYTLTAGEKTFWINTRGEYWNASQWFEFIWTGDYSDFDFQVKIWNTSTNDTQFMWIRVISPTFIPIKNAKVRLYQRYYDVNENDDGYKIVGQVLTDQDGWATFWYNRSQYYKIETVKDGYLFDIVPGKSEIGNTQDSPILIVGGDVEEIIGSGWNYLPSRIFNRTIPFDGAIVNLPGLNWTYNTEYRVSRGNGTKNMVNGQIHTSIVDNVSYYIDKYTYYMEFEPGIDFNSSGIDNITIYMYLSDVLNRNHTIEYSIYNTTQVGSILGLGLTSKYILPLLWIVVVVLSVTISFFIKSSTGSIGFHTFMVGNIILTGLSWSYFWAVGMSSIFYYFLIFIKKFIGVNQ